MKESVTEFACLLFHNHILHAVCKSYNIWKSLKGLVGKNCLCLFMLEFQFLIRFFNWQFFLMIINWFSVWRIESIARKNPECVWATIFSAMIAYLHNCMKHQKSIIHFKTYFSESLFNYPKWVKVCKFWCSSLQSI